MNYNARQTYYYWRLYQHFLINHGLDDDSKTITVNSLFDFVDNQIDEEEREELMKFCTEAY